MRFFEFILKKFVMDMENVTRNNKFQYLFLYSFC